MKKIILTALVLVALAAPAAFAGNVNFTSSVTTAVPVVGGGWTYDEISAAFTDSLSSPYPLALAGPTYFSITDQFIVGDTYYVYDGAALILTTSLNGAQASMFPIGDPLGDAGWTSGGYQHGQVVLAPGAHSIRVQGNGAGGVPAGFYTRLDPVPEPGTLTLLALGAMTLLRRRS